MFTPTILDLEDGAPAPDCSGYTSLHRARDKESLCQEASRFLTEILPDVNAAVLFNQGFSATVELAVGPRCPLLVDSTVELSEWSKNIRDIPMHYAGEPVGRLRHDGEATPEQDAELEKFLEQLTVALVNQKLNSEALRTTEQYCASLQAFEEGVVLFQERNREAVGARFLTLMSHLLSTQVGALLILDKIGDPTSGLKIDQLQGLPEFMIEELQSEDGKWWPETVIQESVDLIERDPATGECEGLDTSSVPDALNNLVHCPLRYHGVDVGLLIAFNVQTDTTLGLRLERVRRLAELGAALFHRLALEQNALRSREIETQLSIASTIQARLIPQQAPDNKNVECAWNSDPAQSIGGDYVDLIETDDGSVNAVIADVSGHGIDSALVMASFRAAIRAECTTRDVGDTLSHLNNEVGGEVGDTGMFITSAVMRFDAAARRCTFSSAGHNECLLYRDATNTIELLESQGPSLGMFAGMSYDQVDVSVEPGDVLLLYTDGIVEATDPNDEMFGDDRLRSKFLELAKDPVDDILTGIQTAVNDFLGTASVDDDVTIAVIRVV